MEVSMQDNSVNRLKEIIRFDKEKISKSLLSLIKSDVFSLFSSYFETDIKDVSINYFVGEDNKYHFKIDIVSTRVKKNVFFANSL